MDGAERGIHTKVSCCSSSSSSRPTCPRGPRGSVYGLIWKYYILIHGATDDRKKILGKWYSLHSTPKRTKWVSSTENIHASCRQVPQRKQRAAYPVIIYHGATLLLLLYVQSSDGGTEQGMICHCSSMCSSIYDYKNRAVGMKWLMK